MPLTAIPGQETAAPGRRPHLGALSTCTLRHASDERLVALTRNGSERAFAEVMRRYERPLHYYCLQMVGAPRAEDAVQQAFMQAFVALRDGERREIALRPWLYRIARNCAIDLLRKQHEHDELDPDFDGMPQPPGVFEQKEELARVVAAIQALPEGQRRALTLRELEGRSYGEISAELGHTDSGVRQLIFRARTALRNLGAVLVLPLGSARWRLFGAPSTAAADPHAIAVAAGVSSGGGNALGLAGTVVAATLTLLGAPAAPRHDLHATGSAAAASASPAPASARPVVASAVSGRATHRAAADRANRTGGSRVPAGTASPDPQAVEASATPVPPVQEAATPPPSEDPVPATLSAEPAAAPDPAPVTASGPVAGADPPPAPAPTKPADPAPTPAPQATPAPAPVSVPLKPVDAPRAPKAPKVVPPRKPASPKKPSGAAPGRAAAGSG